MLCRTFASVCWLAVLSLFLWPRSLPAQEKIRVGLSSISATNGSIWVAEEKGLFKKYGVDTEVIFIGGGGARVVSSLHRRGDSVFGRRRAMGRCAPR